MSGQPNIWTAGRSGVGFRANQRRRHVTGAQDEHGPTGRARAGRRAAGPGHQPRLRGAGRKLPRRARRPLRRAGPPAPGDVPVRGRGGEHGGGVWQTDGAPRRRHGDARPWRLPRRHRRPHRHAGQHAAAAVRGPDPVRRDRPRQLPGGRLPPHVRPARQVGDADRRRGAHPGAGRARGRRGDDRAARSRGDRAVRGNAEARGRRARPGPRPRLRPAARPGGDGAHDGDAGPRATAARHPGRLVLEHGRARRRAGVPGGARHPRCRGVPAPGGVRRHPRELRGRPGRRVRPRTRGPRAAGRPGAGHRDAAGRGHDAGLPAVRPGGRHPPSSTSTPSRPRSGACSARRWASPRT